MRTNDKIRIEEKSTKSFFSDRARKYSKSNPYSVTMYQDDNPQLVQQRNDAEIEKLMPIIDVSGKTRILDIGCGIGRWADAIKKFGIRISEYYGVDFSEDLIKIANDRNDDDRYHFVVGGINEIERLFDGKKFNSVIMMGVAIYLNDDVLENGLRQISSVCEEKANIVFRETIGIEKRLSLKDFYSDELKAEYNAIYRTKEELIELYGKTIVKSGFILDKCGQMYEEKLNNRKETTQWFFSYRR